MDNESREIKKKHFNKQEDLISLIVLTDGISEDFREGQKTSFEEKIWEKYLIIKKYVKILYIK